jgi:hypothetical protein
MSQLEYSGKVSIRTTSLVDAGYLDAEVNVERSLLRPVVGGSVRVSRGAAFLFPQAAPASPAAAAGGASLAPPAGSPQVRHCMVR